MLCRRLRDFGKALRSLGSERTRVEPILNSVASSLALAWRSLFDALQRESLVFYGIK
jgi:hypothetical protein